MRSLLSTFLILSAALTALSQGGGRISGTVSISGRAAAGATVTATPKGYDKPFYSAVTNANGEFAFNLIEPGEYMIAASLNVSGVVRVSRAIAAVTVNHGGMERVVLELGDAVGGSVTISAGLDQTIEQVSKTVDIIDGQQMRDRADFSLIDSLRTIPGFRIQQSGGFGKVATIKTRGLRNQDTAVLLDGIRFRDASGISGDATPFLSDITLTNVNEVEVLRGSGSSLYGTNAIGGTIDHKTPPARLGTHGQIAGAGGGLGLGRFRGILSHGTGGGRFGATAGVSRTVYTEGIDGDDDARNTNFQGRVDVLPWRRTAVSGRFFFSDASVKLNNSPDTFGPLPATTTNIIDARAGVNFIPDANDPDNRQRSRSYVGHVQVTQAVNENVSFGGYYAVVDTGRENTNGPLGTGFQPFGGSQSFLYYGRIHTANVHADWSPRSHVLKAGFEFEHESFGNIGLDNSNPADPYSEATAQQSSRTFYAQDLVRLFDARLQISGAVRAQWFSLKRPSFSSQNYPVRYDADVQPPASYTGDAAASYYFAKTGTKLRMHVGNGYRVPSLFERFGASYFLSTFFGLGNPALKPERSVGIDGGIEQSLAGGKVRLTGTYFYTKINDEITYLPTDDLSGPAYFNADKHFSRGLETSASIRPTASTDIFASYTFTNSDVRNFRRPTPVSASLVSREFPAFGIPEHQFTLAANQRIGRLWINFDLLATSTYLAPVFSNTNFSTYIYRFRGNRRGDLTAGYNFRLGDDARSLRLYGTVENVFDQEYYDNGFRAAGATARAGATFAF